MALKNAQIEITLDRHFPRVFGYRLASGPTLEGALPSHRPLLELNEEIYTPSGFQVSSRRVGQQQISYILTFPSLSLRLTVVFELKALELVMRLGGVEENGRYRLKRLYFPDHFLARMPALTPGAMMYRGEYHVEAWKDPVNRGGYSMSIPRFASVRQEDAEQCPMRVNWAATYAPGICATIANNIGTWKLSSQFLGGSGRASDFAFWNGRYHYRLQDKVQPLLESRIAILTEDKNDDSSVDWMEAALWHRELLPEPNPMYAEPVHIYKILNAWVPPPPSNKPVTTFDECLPIIQSIERLTGGLPQIVFLVGWQYCGHDSGYPSLDKVNEELGGRDRLIALVKEAKKHNAVISYHINLDDAYREYPGFDPKVLCLDRDGEPYPWMKYVDLQAYHISHTKEVETGYFQKRAQAFLDTVPVEKAVHLDTFRYSNATFGPNEDIGLNDELVLGCENIVKWFAERGIDVSSEGPYDGFYGVLSWFLHRFVMQDPFHLIMMQGKVYGGGKPAEPVGELLGWSMNTGVQARPPKYADFYSPAEFTDLFYLGTLLQFYLAKKKLVFLGPMGEEHIARFGDGTISSQKKGGSLLVKEGEITLADGQDRLIPLNDHELRLYSVTGGKRSWTLPRGWSGQEVKLIELGGSASPRTIRLQGNSFELTMEPRQPYALHKT
ncbi:MAG: endo-alpha-N-acetylgalactosaminidase family protein [Terriglobales bacterium]